MTWTKVDNSFWDGGLMASLPHAELKLILQIIRYTNGFHREWAHLGETQLLEATQLSRTVLYRAKQGLVNRALIEVDKSGPVCGYRLALLTPSGEGSQNRDGSQERHGSQKWDGSVNPDGSHERDGTRVESGTGRGPKIGTGSILKESIKETFKETSSLSPFEPPPADDDACHFSGEESNASASSDRTPPGGAPAIGPAEQLELARQLRSIGVHSRKAMQLARDKPDATKKALADLPHRQGHVESPPAWIVAEIDSGGYSAPPALVAQQAREVRSAKVSSERQAEQAAREAEALRARRLWDAMLAQSSEAELAEMLRESRAYYAKISPRMAEAGPEANHIRAQMLELFRARASPGLAQVG